MADLTTTKHLFDALKRMYDPTAENNVGRPLRYVIYARKSTDDSDKQTRSLGDQMSECVEYVNEFLAKKPFSSKVAYGKRGQAQLVLVRK